MDRDYAAALVMLLWAIGKLPASGTGVVGGDAFSSTSDTSKRKPAGSMKQLGRVKRQKSRRTQVRVGNPGFNEVSLGSS